MAGPTHLVLYAILSILWLGSGQWHAFTFWVMSGLHKICTCAYNSACGEQASFPGQFWNDTIENLPRSQATLNGPGSEANAHQFSTLAAMCWKSCYYHEYT